MTYDTPRPPAPRQDVPTPQFDVDMRSTQDGRQTLRQTGNLEQRANQQQTQQGTMQQDGSVRQDVNGQVRQNVDGNTLRTGDIRSSNQAGGASIDNHSTVNRTDKSVNVGSQFLPECTVGMSIGVPGSGAFQIGVPSKSCIVARGQAMEAQASAQKEIARANADVEIARTHADRDTNIANINANERLASQRIDNGHVESLTKTACDFSIGRAGTARQSWQQFDGISSKIGSHPTARASAQQLWGEAVTASAQSMEAGSICVESTRSQLGLEQRKFEVPPLTIETPKVPKPVQKPVDKPSVKPCPDETKKK